MYVRMCVRIYVFAIGFRGFLIILWASHLEMFETNLVRGFPLELFLLLFGTFVPTVHSQVRVHIFDTPNT